MKTRLPSAIVYHWDRQGEVILTSDIYYQERLFDKVIVYSMQDDTQIEQDFAKFRPDLVISFKPITVSNQQIQKRTRVYQYVLPDNVLANDIVCQSTFINCKNETPEFSIFTPAYKTGDRINRAYNSLKSQTFTDWEWVVVDDSPENDSDTWNRLSEIASKDHRVKPHRIFPLTGGNVGLAKHRAGMLCEGKWLVELDHDDELLPNCLQECYDASCEYPDAGFIYSDFTTPYEDGTFKHYDSDFSGDWYARPDNFFCFGYAGHEWQEIDGKRYLRTYYPEINPRTIRFNITMPNHVRIWRKDIYHQIGGHNKHLPVADDLELIIKAFLVTKFIHVRKLLYIQYHNHNSTVDNNVININRLSRLIRDHYDQKIHDRIIELGGIDWDWNEENKTSYRLLPGIPRPKYYEEERYLNYIYGEEPTMNLHIITRVTRPEYIQEVWQSIENAKMKSTNIKWHVIVDLNANFSIDTEMLRFLKQKTESITIERGEPNTYGYLLINKIIDTIPNNDYFYILDDDNAINPDFFKRIWSLRSKRGFLVFDQLVEGKDFTGLQIREAKIENMKWQGVDVGQLVLHKGSIEDVRFEGNYSADGFFVQKLVERFPNKFYFINETLTNYNFFTK